MKLRVYGKNYKLRNSLALPAKATLRQILEKVKVESEIKNIPEFYTTFVIMMYVVSASILKEMTVQNILDLTDEIKRERNQNKENKEKKD